MQGFLVLVAAGCLGEFCGAVAAAVWLFAGVCPQVPIEHPLQLERGTATRVRAFVRFVVFGVLQLDVVLEDVFQRELVAALGAREGFEAGVCPVVVPGLTQVCRDLSFAFVCKRLVTAGAAAPSADVPGKRRFKLHEWRSRRCFVRFAARTRLGGWPPIWFYILQLSCVYVYLQLLLIGHGLADDLLVIQREWHN